MNPTYVSQRHWTGCAIACIAIVTGRTYDAVARRAFGGREYAKMQRLSYHSDRRDFSLSTAVMLKTLRAFGLGAQLSSRFRFGSTAIVTLLNPTYETNDKGEQTLHCVVYDHRFGGRIIDPADPVGEPRSYYLDRWRAAKKIGEKAILLTG